MHILETLNCYLNNWNATLTIFKNQLNYRCISSFWDKYIMSWKMSSYPSSIAFFLASCGAHLWLVGNAFAPQDCQALRVFRVDHLRVLQHRCFCNCGTLRNMRHSLSFRSPLLPADKIHCPFRQGRFNGSADKGQVWIHSIDFQ